MMLRSSSTPILGSLLSPSSETPDTRSSPSHNKVSLPHSPLSQKTLNTFSSNSSPISPSIKINGFRRAQSEGNLASLTTTASTDDFSFSTPSKKLPSRHHSSSLETIPSFSFHNSKGRLEGDEYSDEEEQEDEEINKYGCPSDNPIKVEGRFEDSNFDMEKNMTLNEEMSYSNVALKDQIEEHASKMFLAKGLGVDIGFGSSGGGRGGRNYTQVDFSEEGDGSPGGEGQDVEEHYKRMVNENPGNSLFLRNYAQFLHQSKKDLNGAEEYYSRAILADPNDGEILSKYANIQWELHHDKDRATNYYEQAVQAASEDSHVHAAYANFLWEIEDDDEDEAPKNSYAVPPLVYNGALTSAIAYP